MENRTNLFNRSASMPVLQQKDEAQEQEGRARFENSHGGVSILEAQENFRIQNAKVWSRNGLSNGFLGSPVLSNGVQYGRGSEQNGSPSSSKPKEKAHNVMNGSSPSKATDSTPRDAEVTAVLGKKKAMMETLANSPVFRPQKQPSIYALAGPPSSALGSTQGPSSPFWRSPLAANGNGVSEVNDHSYPLSEDSKTIKDGDMNISENRLPGLGHSSPATDKTSPPEAFKVPSGNLHYRRQSSRLSSLPNIPSPLRPQHYTEHLGSNVSGLVSPMPNTATANGQRQDIEAQNGAQVFGLHSRQPMPNGNGGPVRKPPTLGFVQGRKDTDPFIEPADKWSLPQKDSPFVTQATQRLTFPSSPEVQVPSTPMFYQQDFESLVDSPEPWVPLTPGREFDHVRSPVFQPYYSRVPETPFSQGFDNNLPPRMDLPIPPPPLSSVQGHLRGVHSPNTRARLDDHAPIRGNWIRNEAQKIVDLSRLSLAAAQRFQQTRTQEDYGAWQRLVMAYEDAINLEKRQEERRNMFMPHGVKAMKTSVVNIDGDQSAAYAAVREANANAANGSQEEGQLLGFQMAYMERVCAEIKRRADEKEDKGGEISLEMLDMLSLEEKKALREHLVARLESVTAGKKAGVLSESFV